MSRPRPYSVTALAAWTLFTWGTRILLAWGNDSLSAGEKVLATVPIVVFVALAAATLVAVLRTPGPLAGGARHPAVVLAGWTVVYWAVRLPLILVHDHPIGFKVVHTVLAGVAIGLAGWAASALRTRPASQAPAFETAGPASRRGPG